MSSPARAQEDSAAAIDALIGESADAASGVALARRQAAAGDLLAALATVERLRLAYQDDEDMWLLHASLLCRLDDGAGARLELDQIGDRPVSDAAWAEVTAACGAMSRPGQPPASGPGGSAGLRSGIPPDEDSTEMESAG